MREVTVLVVEDEENWRLILTTLISQACDCRCETATTFVEAVRILRKIPVDLAILDIMLPDYDHKGRGGIDVLNWLAEHGCETKVVILTAYQTLELTRKSLTNPAVIDYLDKAGFEISAFQTLIQRTIKNPE